MKTLTKVLLILLVSYFVAAANGASFEIFLKIEGIEGDSTDSMHPNEINAVSFKMGVLQEGGDLAPGGGGTFTAQFTPLTVFKFIDKASPQLFIKAAKGDHIPSARVVVRKSGPNPFTIYQLVLDNVLISSVSDNASTTDQNGNLLEQITLNCSRITWTFFPSNADGRLGGAIHTFFDLTSGKGGEGE